MTRPGRCSRADARTADARLVIVYSLPTPAVPTQATRGTAAFPPPRPAAVRRLHPGRRQFLRNYDRLTTFRSTAAPPRSEPPREAGCRCTEERSPSWAAASPAAPPHSPHTGAARRRSRCTNGPPATWRTAAPDWPCTTTATRNWRRRATWTPASRGCNSGGAAGTRATVHCRSAGRWGNFRSRSVRTTGGRSGTGCAPGCRRPPCSAATARSVRSRPHPTAPWCTLRTAAPTTPTWSSARTATARWSAAPPSPT